MFTFITSLCGSPSKADTSLCSSEGFPPLVDAVVGVVMIIIGSTLTYGTIPAGGSYALIAFGSLEVAPLVQHVLSALRDSCCKREQEPEHRPTPGKPQSSAKKRIEPPVSNFKSPPQTEDPLLNDILQDADLLGSNLGSHFVEDSAAQN